jgi:putative transposase
MWSFVPSIGAKSWQEFPELKRKLPSLWTNAYYVGTVGGVTLEVVKRHVESQKGK